MRPVTEAPPAVGPEETVHAVLARYPAAGAVFERLGIHTCCGGDVPLRAAAERDGVEIERLLQEVREAIRQA